MKKDVLIRAYIVTLVLICAIVIGSKLFDRDALNIRQNDIRKVSLARKEATLSQEISKSALSMEFAGTESKFNSLKTGLDKATKELEQIHTALKTKNGTMGLDNDSNSPQLEDLFKSINPYYEAILTSSVNLQNIKWEADEREKLVLVRTNINSILNTENQFISYIDRIVAEYESEFDSHRTGFGTYEIVFLASLLGLLLLQAFLIFRPAVNLANKNFLSANAAFQRLKKSEVEIRRATERQLEINEKLILSQRSIEKKNRQLQNSESELLKRTEEQIKANERLIGAQAQIEEALKQQKIANIQLQEAQEAAKVNEERLTAAIKGARDGIWDWNLISNEVYFSPQYKAMLGYEEHEMANNFTEWETKIHPEDLPTAQAKVNEYLGGQTDNYEYEFRMRHRNGEYLWILTRGASIKNEEGVNVRFAGSHTDITQRRINEEEIRQFNMKLQESEDRIRAIAEEQLEVNERMIIAERKLQKALKEEQKSREELATTLNHLKGTQTQLVQSEKMASLGQLTAGIAHEINNPINFVYNGIDTIKVSFDELMIILNKYNEIKTDNDIKRVIEEVNDLKEEYVYDELIDDIQELISDVKKGAVRTMEIVKGLRVFSRLDEEEMKPANLNESLDATLILLKNKTKNRLEVRKFYDDSIEEINCFPGQLNQVFMNILNNAIQAIPDERKDGEIQIYTENQEEHIMIRIKDNGGGMPETVRRRIFEPFFTTKAVGIGTGLGMSISYGIIEKHNGNIFVNSEENVGTEFSIQIPKNLKDSEITREEKVNVNK
jgi:PAS domain S-box-containing protein